MYAICFSNRWGRQTSSASMRARNSPRARSMPSFRVLVKPLLGRETSPMRTSAFAYSVRMASVPSVDPSSMIRNSKSRKVCRKHTFNSLAKVCLTVVNGQQNCDGRGRSHRPRMAQYIIRHESGESGVFEIAPHACLAQLKYSLPPERPNPN